MLGSAAVTQQLCTVATAVSTPLHIRYGNFNAFQVSTVASSRGKMAQVAGYMRKLR